MAGLGTGAGAPIVKVYHERSMILPDVSRVLACLYEKNVQFETVKDSYKDILRLQSTRSVPVPFYDGPTFRQESRAICRYIAETYEQRGYPFLLGKDVLERASIEQWLRHEEHAFDPPSRALFCHLAFPLHDEDMSDIDREKRKLEEVLEVYEQRLGESEFLAGNRFTLADLVHLPNTYHIVESEFAYLYDSRKNVQRWWNTISARDSWQQVVRDMQSVEEQNQIEELEQEQLEQQWQWEAETPPTSGRRILRIDPRQQTGTKSRTILVPPPSGGAISSSFFTVQQEQRPLPAEITSHAPNQTKKSNFFTTTEKTPAPSKQRTPTTEEPPSSVQSTMSNFFTPATPPTTTKMSPKTDKDKATSKDASSPTKTSQRSTGNFFTPPTTTTMPQRANTDKSTSKDASSPTRPSQGSSKEAPDKLHLSDFYKASSHADETANITKPTPKEASKTSDRISAPRQTSEVVAPDEPSPASPRTSSRIDGPERKPTSVDPYTKPGDSQTPRSPDTRPAQRAAGTSGPDAGERSSNQRSVVQTTYAQRPSEQANKVTADQRATSKISEHVAAKDIQGETAQVRYRDARDSTKEAREADQKRAALATTRELPSGSQIIPQQSKAPPTSLKASDLSPVQEGYEDTQGEDERFSTKRLRKMIEQSDPAALKSQPTDLQTPPIQEETTSILKNPSYVQDRKGQAGNSSAVGKTDSTVSNGTRDPGTPSTGARDPDTPTTADATRATSLPKGGVAPDGRAASATEPRELQSINEQQPAPPMPSQSPKTAGVDRTEQPRTPNKTSTEQSDKSTRQMGEQKMQSDKSSISPQDNGKQGSEAALLTNADQNIGKTSGQALQESQKLTSSDTQQVKNNRSNSTSDGSSKPTRQIDGNEGNVPETQRGG